ncbi:hypothetical protein PIB30_063720 [Stylosanthes scabra]|uniref:Uncharacterized protein n=1 Tax=Stylosanthes scabra TaxID=79078 RepID=A0ABU6UKZ1_9FABA|nr:hypothetical protein [Stylosanthes scabra]
MNPKSKRYTGKRRIVHILSGSGAPSGSGFGSASGSGPTSGSGTGSANGSGPGSEHANWSATGFTGMGEEFGPNIAATNQIPAQNVPQEEIPEEDIAYDYASEGFHSSPGSVDERRLGPAGPIFNEEEARYGEVQLVLGMQFASMKIFRNALKDVFVFEARDL